MEMPEQLPNSGMDEWNVETYIKEGGWFSRDETYYSFNPWKNDEDHFGIPVMILQHVIEIIAMLIYIITMDFMQFLMSQEEMV